MAVLELVGDVTRLRLLDLACGHGRLARELARRGAQVVGIDLSQVLLDKARALERAEPLGIRYVHADASDPDGPADINFPHRIEPDTADRSIDIDAARRGWPGFPNRSLEHGPLLSAATVVDASGAAGHAAERSWSWWVQCLAAQALAAALPNARRRTLAGQTHAVAPATLARVGEEFFLG